MQHIITLIAQNIGINVEDITKNLDETILRQIDTFQVPQDLKDKIDELIEQDKEINKFGDDHKFNSKKFTHTK